MSTKAQTVVQVPNQPGVTSAALSMFFNLAARLDLETRDEAALLGVTEKTVSRYMQAHYRRDHQDLRPDTLERVSHFVSTYLDLRSLFRDDDDALAWLRSKNERFGGATPLERMLGGRVVDLVEVRQFVQEALTR
jgi:hypothetical protein